MNKILRKKRLIDSDLIMNYYDEYTTMHFKGKINNDLFSIGLGIEHDVDWYVTLTFTNGRFISVDDNDINVVEYNDGTEYYLKLSPNGSQFGKITAIYLELTTISIRV